LINFMSLNLDKLEKISHGGFGVIYRDGPKAIKIYHSTVKTGYGSVAANPSLYFNKTKLTRLLKKEGLIKNTDLIQDVVCIDDKFVGVVYPYYEGITLDKCKDYPLDSRINMSRQIVENAKELTDHKIYPLDYKLNNMMFIDDKVKLLDLDDFYTKVRLVKSPRLLRKSNKILDETLKTLLGEYDYFSYIDSNVRELLMRNYFTLNDNYDDINKYLDDREKPVKFLLVDSDTDINTLLRNDDYLLLFINDDMKSRELFAFINRYNLSLYDVIKSNRLDRYLNNHNVDECIDKTGSKVLRMIK